MLSVVCTTQGEPDPAARAVLSPAPSARQARELSPTSPYARARPSEPFRDQACGAAASPGTLGLGLDMNSFMPAALAKGASGGGSGTTRREEHEMIDRMMAPHSTLTAILSTRYPCSASLLSTDMRMYVCMYPGGQALRLCPYIGTRLLPTGR